MSPASLNVALLIVGKAALKEAQWRNYSEYCLARHNGLRKNAFHHLDEFLLTAGSWSFEERKKFTAFLYAYLDANDDPDFDILPNPLYTKLIEPTLISWCKVQETDSKPFRWLGDTASLLKALEINPSDNIAREKLLKIWMFEIYFSVHHLPSGFISSQSENLLLAIKAKEQIMLLTNTSKKMELHKSLLEDEELIVNYLDWKKSGAPDFKQWGIGNKKNVGYRHLYKE